MMYEIWQLYLMMKHTVIITSSNHRNCPQAAEKTRNMMINDTQQLKIT